MQPLPSADVPAPVVAPQAHTLTPPAHRARRTAVIISVIAVLFSLPCGFCFRKTFALREDPEAALPFFLAALVLLLVALMLRMVAAICELLWLERTWRNLPVEMRNVGPMEKVDAVLLVGLSIVPGVSWVWKLGLIVAIANGFEMLRAKIPFEAPVPKRLGMAAVITGWVPGLNVYVAPFLWEMFASRTETVIHQLMASRASST
ncbi:MAG TPA: hypothetical protein VIF62_32935 [Labilithrix sp.]